ncbi:Molybdopterin molybdenumtransferase [Streptomyces sp. RB5]|uniref:Molybdopterin molybdenumtransferase n=1 Tax=Streptomyces smaragdinus TaxID=2585196 RepID=A0A7K0CGX9_9ACTN|nr:molybdopterin molybdotransferase MoeA [Streptomyces smaragdinus]MQY12735.1 Molybdopterin molybdenumtransferase [Streptomyces smaragdinus]
MTPRRGAVERDEFDEALSLGNAHVAPQRAQDPEDYGDAFTLDERAPAPRPRHRPHGTPWPDARRAAARAARPAAPRPRPLAQAVGEVLAAPLEALADLPPFDTSAMDGYAVTGPGPWRLASGQGLLAGDRAARPLADGTAVRIATGARIPPGATAVVRTEHAELRPDGTLLTRDARAVRTGQDIRPRGQECRSGTPLLPAGAEITPAVVGLAAAAGYDELSVIPRPRVEVLVLGQELLHRGLPADGRIRDALGPMLAPWLQAMGADAFVTRRLGDDAELLYEAVGSSTAQLIVTTGGTAAGPVDHVHGVLARLKADLLVDGVRVRPGHPMLLARLPNGAHVTGLPGNPLAAVTGLMTLAGPLLSALRGTPAAEDPTAALTEDVTGHPTDTRVIPVVRDRRRPGAARPLHFTGPAMLRGLAAAHALAVVPPGGARAGDAVALLPLPWGGTG